MNDPYYKKIHETSFSTRRQRAKNITLDSRGYGMTVLDSFGGLTIRTGHFA